MLPPLCVRYLVYRLQACPPSRPASAMQSTPKHATAPRLNHRRHAWATGMPTAPPSPSPGQPPAKSKD